MVAGMQRIIRETGAEYTNCYLHICTEMCIRDSIIAACIKKDAEITFECEGADEEAALAKMEELEADNFGD